MKVFETEEKAIEVMNKKYSDKKFDTKVIFIPEIKSGLKLYRNNNYYKTIVSTTQNLYSMLDIESADSHTISDPIRPDRLLKWFYDEKVHTNINDLYDNRFLNNDTDVNFENDANIKDESEE